MLLETPEVLFISSVWAEVSAFQIPGKEGLASHSQVLISKAINLTQEKGMNLRIGGGQIPRNLAPGAEQ